MNDHIWEISVDKEQAEAKEKLKDLIENIYYRLYVTADRLIVTIPSWQYIKPELFVQKEEIDLFKAYYNCLLEFNQADHGMDYGRCMEILGKMTPELNAFMDNVKIDIEDKSIKENRMYMLKAVNELVARMGDFGVITKLV